MTTSVEQRTVKFGGDNQWTCRISGEGAPLLWLHGLWGEPEWEPHLEILAQNHQVYAPTLPGYEGSPSPGWMNRVEDVAMLAAEFLEALSLSNVDVVGHSLGAWIGAELAIFRPERVRNLVVVDPLGIATDWTGIPNILYNDPANIPGFFFTDPSSEGARHYCPAPAEWDESYINNRVGLMRVAFKPYMHDPKLAIRLRFVESPTLVLWGKEDRFIGPEHSKKWEDALAHPEVVQIDGAGHYPHVEKSDSCMQAIEDFFGRVKENRQ